MGFSVVFDSMMDSVLSNAAGFVTDFQPFFAAIAGIAFAGFTLLQVRRFIG